MQRKILTWAVLGFRDKPLLREMVQQLWLCNNNSSSHWKEGHTRPHVPTNLGRHHSPLPSHSHHHNLQPANAAETQLPSFLGDWGFSKRRKAPCQRVWEDDRAPGTKQWWCLHRRQSSRLPRSLQLEKKGLKEVGRRATISGVLCNFTVTNFALKSNFRICQRARTEAGELAFPGSSRSS